MLGLAQRTQVARACRIGPVAGVGQTSRAGGQQGCHDLFCCPLGELMMSLLWYYRPEHLQGGRSPSMHEVSCLPWEGAEQEVVALKHSVGRGQLGDSQVPWV